MYSDLQAPPKIIAAGTAAPDVRYVRNAIRWKVYTRT